MRKGGWSVSTAASRLQFGRRTRQICFNHMTTAKTFSQGSPVQSFTALTLCAFLGQIFSLCLTLIQQRRLCFRFAGHEQLSKKLSDSFLQASQVRYGVKADTIHAMIQNLLEVVLVGILCSGARLSAHESVEGGQKSHKNEESLRRESWRGSKATNNANHNNTSYELAQFNSSMTFCTHIKKQPSSGIFGKVCFFFFYSKAFDHFMK